MASNTASILGFLLFSVSTVVQLFFGVLFVYYRNFFPIRARSKFLMAILYIGALNNQIKWFLEIQSDFDCTTMAIVELFIPDVITPIVVRCIRVVIIFKYISKIYSLSDEESPTDWLTRYGKQLVSLRGSIVMTIIVHLLFNFIPLTSMFVSVSSGDPICGTTLRRVGGYFSIGLTLVFVTGTSLLLIKVHDAFYLKWELLLMAILGVLLPAPAYILRTNDDLQEVGTLLMMFSFLIVVIIIPFVIPVCLVWKGHGLTTSSRSDGSFKMGALTSDDRIEEGDEEAQVERKRMDGIKAIIRDKSGNTSVMKFLQHFQMENMTKYFLFWRELDLTADGDPQFFEGKAMVIYQRYVKEGAYLYVDILPHKMKRRVARWYRKKMSEEGMATRSESEERSTEREATSENSEASESFDESEFVFSEILDFMEQYLLKHLFRKYYKSEFYAHYHKSKSLKSGVVGIEA